MSIMTSTMTSTDGTTEGTPSAPSTPAGRKARTARSAKSPRILALATASLTVALCALAGPPAPSASAATPLEQLRTRCDHVLWVGDSTSIAYVGGEGTGTITPGSDKADEPLAAALLATGVQRIDYDVYGGRSAHEEVNGHPDAVTALSALVAAHPEAQCSVYSGGTNDSANISVGSQFSVMDRLTALDGARGKTKLYITTAAIDPSSTVSGYSPEVTAPWNEAIATKWRPDLVINHAGHLAPGQFEQDGIHYTKAGTDARIDLAARVLAGDPDALFERPQQQQ